MDTTQEAIYVILYPDGTMVAHDDKDMAWKVVAIQGVLDQSEIVEVPLFRSKGTVVHSKGGEA